MNKLETINKLAMEIVNDENEWYQASAINAQRIALLSQPKTTSQELKRMVFELKDMASRVRSLQSRRNMREYHQLQHQLVVAMEALNVVESIVRGKELDEIW